MTTVVASPPSFPALPRIGWNANTGQGGFSAMSTEEVSRMFMPQRKVVTRSTSSSSLASNSSSSSTSTVTQTSEASPVNNVESSAQAKKKPRGGFWPVSKAESTSGITNARANGAVQPATPTNANPNPPKNGLQPAISTQNNTTTNGARSMNGVAPPEASALLVLLPMNGTFERKQINVPFYPEMLRIGRQTNAKTVPTPNNGFFDSKVLSRQHAEIWAEKNGKVWIRDVKSSNGTFVNGQRLSPENRESEPHELRQHDSLELGIDIVSEDQKTIVHHKVSAKVEFVGLPGNSNNVLDLSFGDLDPSHGNSLLASSMTSPMVHSRSQPGRVGGGRGSGPSSLAGSHMGSMAQRQANYWGAPLNIEQLVKQVSVEMRAARQQTQDLQQANTFLTSMIPSDGNSSKIQPPKESPQQPRQSNGKIKQTRVDNAARFADPPAPPPQQPLPEKPDGGKASSPAMASPSFTNMLKRENTVKTSNSGLGGSPTSTQSSQILSLVEALSIAKKELDSQGMKVKQLEDMLKQERSAREAAEEKAKRLEESASARPVAVVEEVVDTKKDSVPPQDQVTSAETKDDEAALQHRLDGMMADMQKMKTDLEHVTKRADTAETDANNARASLAEMIERLKKENVEAVKETKEGSLDKPTGVMSHLSSASRSNETPSKELQQANGHIRSPKLPEHLQRAVATVLLDGQSNGEMTAQSAPYVSMLGVVLIGVGVMAYLNSWQKADK